MSLEKLGNILGQETVKEIYFDAGSRALKQGGKAAEDTMKALRLFTAPIQLMGAWQDRFEKYLEKVRGNVKEENQTEAAPSISGPVLERLQYMEENNPLTELYLNLLERAIDKERLEEAHPAFYHIIDQLSADEALILFKLTQQKRMEYSYSMDLYVEENGESRFKPAKMYDVNFPLEDLCFQHYLHMYFSHLEALNLIWWSRKSEDAIWENEGTEEKKQTGTLIKTTIGLREFGLLFTKACIPEKAFIVKPTRHV